MLRIIREEQASLSALLRAMEMMIHRGPGDEPHCFFDVLRAMLFYIDEFPERLHHPKESDLRAGQNLSPIRQRCR